VKIKKHICILQALLLLASNISLALDVHYCNNTIASVSVKTSFLNPNSEDGCCGDLEKKSSCCKDKVFKFEKKSDHFITKSLDSKNHFNFYIQESKPIFFARKSKFKAQKTTFYTCNTHAPPIYKSNCQLIFYA
jgi:hypothetical protein